MRPFSKGKESKGFAMSECNCRFPGCDKVLKNVQGRGRHEGWHVERGDAVYAFDGGNRTIIPRDPSIPAPIYDTSKYANVRDRKAKEIGGIPIAGVCEICQRSDFKNRTGFQIHRGKHVKRGDAVWVKRPSRDSGELGVLAPIDGKVLAKGVVEIPKPFEHPQIELDRSRRAVDRMRDAIILTSVAEMLEEVGAADQLLQMLAALRGSQRS